MYTLGRREEIMKVSDGKKMKDEVAQVKMDELLEEQKWLDFQLGLFAED